MPGHALDITAVMIESARVHRLRLHRLAEACDLAIDVAEDAHHNSYAAGERTMAREVLRLLFCRPSQLEE